MAEKKKRGIGVWILMGFLMLGLVGFGSTSLIGTSNRLATVGDREITAQEFYNALRNVVDNQTRSSGVPYTFAQARADGVDMLVLGRLIQQRSLDNEVRQRGLSVGDNRLRSEIVSNPGFQALDGSFDRNRYRQALQQQGMSESRYEDSIRTVMARQLIDWAAVSGAAPADIYGATIATWAAETRDATWTFVGPEALTDPLPAPTEADLQTQYESDPARYTRPELRQITYAWLSPDMILDEVVVDDADVQALYDSRIGEYVLPERRLVERLVYPDQAQAEAAIARLTAGETDFETLVIERGLALSDTDMGDVGLDELGGAGEVVFAATSGEVVGPAPSRFGPALYRVNAVLSAQETTLDDVAEDLRSELASQRAQRLIQELSEDLHDMLAGGETLEVLAETTYMELGTIDWSADNAEGIAAYDAFRAAAATVSEDDFPTLLQFDDGGVFTLRLDGVTPPALLPLDEVRDQVAADWTAAAENAAVLAAAEAMADRVRAEGSAALDTITTNTAPGLRRSDFIEGTSPGFAAVVFSLDPGGVAVIPHEDGAIVVTLDSVHGAEQGNAEMAMLREMVAADKAQAINADIYSAFATAIQIGTEVGIDQAALNSIYTQLQ